MATLPLSGVRVVDLTRDAAGPFCTRLLADYGADVIKIEEPAGGDPARRLGPFYHDEPGIEKSGLFLFLNTGKRGMTLDLKTLRGKELLKELARKADVLVENLPPGTMPDLGLGYETLSRLNPRLVMTSISNFGQSGPYRDWKGVDLTLWAMGGAMNATGHPEREPLRIAGRVPSFYVGTVAALATSTALWKAQVQGEGDHLDVSFFEAWMGSVDRRSASLASFQYTGDTSMRPWPDSALAYGTLACADGFFNIRGGGEMFERVARMLGVQELLKRPEWATETARAAPERIDEFNALLVPWMMERTKAEIQRQCHLYGVTGAPVNTVADLLADPHLRERHFFQEIDHPATGPLLYPGYHTVLHTETEPPPRRRAPLLGEHTAEVLCDDLGYGREDVVALRAQGVV